MTLVEIIVSIALFGILIGMALLVLTSGMLLAMRSSDRTVQTNVASTSMNVRIAAPSDDEASEPDSAQVYFNFDDKGTTEPSDTIQGLFVTTLGDSNFADGISNDTVMEAFVPTE